MAVEPHAPAPVQERIAVTRLVDAGGRVYCQIPPLFGSAVALCTANQELTIQGERYHAQCYERIAWASADNLREGWCAAHFVALLDLDAAATPEAA